MSVKGLDSFPFAESQRCSDLRLCYINKIGHTLMEETAYGGLDGTQKENSVYIERAMVIQRWAFHCVLELGLIRTWREHQRPRRNVRQAEGLTGEGCSTRWKIEGLFLEIKRLFPLVWTFWVGCRAWPLWIYQTSGCVLAVGWDIFHITLWGKPQ